MKPFAIENHMHLKSNRGAAKSTNSPICHQLAIRLPPTCAEDSGARCKDVHTRPNVAEGGDGVLVCAGGHADAIGAGRRALTTGVGTIAVASGCDDRDAGSNEGFSCVIHGSGGWACRWRQG